ncbi:MAG: ABC-2 transporter permease [Clostridia bacterium]|nr:ABC-2 transporter permease [Clostridia bacterium]
MKCLFLKDFYVLIKNFKLYLLMELIFIAAFLWDSSNATYLFFSIMTIGLIPISLLNNDEQTRWNEYSGTLPCSKALIVSEKYLFELILQLSLFMIMTIAMFFSETVYHNGIFSDCIFAISAMHLCSLLMPTLYFPFCIKFGIERGRIAYYIICGPLFALGFSLLQNNFKEVAQTALPSILPLVLCGIPLLFIISWFLSIKFYRAK